MNPRQILMVAAALLSSCSGSVESTSAPSAQQSAFADAYAHAVCDNLTPCCVSAGYEGAVEDCFERLRSRSQELMDAAHGAGAVYDPDAGARCIEAKRAITEECLTYKDPIAGGDACNHVFTGGDKGLGETCSAWECAGTAACYTTISQAGSESVCVDYRIAKEGESCASPADAHAKVHCDRGLDCRDGTCRPLRALGDDCPDGFMGDFCEPGATCDWHDTKQCVPARAYGETCTDQTQCEGYSCVEGKCVRTAVVGMCIPRW